MQAVRELPESGPGHCRVIQVSAPRWFGDSQRLPAFWELEQKLSGLRTQSESEPPVFLFCLPIVYSVRRDADVVPPPCLTVGRPLESVSQGRRSPTSQSPGARETTLYGGLPPLASTASAVILSSFSIPPSQQSPKAQRSGHQETQ